MGSCLASGGRFGGLRGQFLTKFWSPRPPNQQKKHNPTTQQPNNPTTQHPTHPQPLSTRPGGMREAIKSAAPCRRARYQPKVLHKIFRITFLHRFFALQDLCIDSCTPLIPPLAPRIPPSTAFLIFFTQFFMRC